MTEVVTGEAVVIDVPCARFPSRMLALAIDVVVQLVALAILLGVTLAISSGLNGAAVAAISLTVMVGVIVGYPIIFETLSRGKSLGKLALGLRVVSDDGGPERFRQALMRALTAVLEIWMSLGFLALVASVLSPSGKRLGDVFAGTFVIQERLPQRRSVTVPAAEIPSALAGWATSLELSGLTDATAETARQFISRYYELTPATREEFGRRIASAVAAQVSPVPPPGTSPADYLWVVLTERRRRAQARLMGSTTPATPATPGAPPTATPATSPAAPVTSATYASSAILASSAAPVASSPGLAPAPGSPAPSSPAPSSPDAADPAGSASTAPPPQDSGRDETAATPPPGFHPPA